MSDPVRLYAVATERERPDEQPALLSVSEQAYVTETPTGLRFESDTPIEVWGALTERLIRQHKRMEWAIGDALQFGEYRYGDMYTQWAEETGLAENTLSTIKWVAGKIESSRRREDVGWSHHREVAPLEPETQDRLLSEASARGMTRFELRQAVKVEQEQIRGRAVTAEGEPICAADLVWVPALEDLTADARRSIEARAPLGRLRSAFISGALFALLWAGVESAFIEGRYRP